MGARPGREPLRLDGPGGIATAVDDLALGPGVACPTTRYHPAVIAQAAATAATMAPGRFSFGVGTGERLNEHVVGERWPEHEVRLSMLVGAVEITRRLFGGGQHSYHGEHYTVENAELYTLPATPPPIVVSAYGERAARVAADVGDGFWTVGPRGDLLDCYREAGGEGPAYTQVTVSYADDRETAVDRAYERWPTTALQGELSTELSTPAHFEQAVQNVSRGDVAVGSTLCDPDPEAHVGTVREAVDAGFDRVQVHDVGTDPDGFFETYADEVLPAVEG